MAGLDIHIRRKAFDEAPVLQDLHLQVGGGEILALVGPSGVGKTTALRLLAGLDDFDGEISRSDGRAGAPEEVGLVFQEPRLMPWLSVADNLRLVLPAGSGSEARIRELLDAVGLGERAQAWPNQLSGGMQRRVALARAFAIRPELLLLDEPFVSLDRPTAETLHQLLLELWRTRRCTVILVTHDLEEAMALADRICFLSAPPARVLVELPLPMPRDAIDARRRAFGELAARHPELLSGRLAPAPADTGEPSARPARGRS